LEDFELDKFKTVLAYKGDMAGNSAAALINLLDYDNLEAFNLIDAKDAEALGKYYARENGEKPDNVSFEQYGNQCAKEENGVFTEQGYLCCKYKELLPKYTGITPDGYQTTGMALYALRLNAQKRAGYDGQSSVAAESDGQSSVVIESDGQSSVVEKIRTAQKTPRRLKEDSPNKNRRKKKGEQDL